MDEEDEEKNKALQEELFRTARNHSIEEMQKGRSFGLTSSKLAIEGLQHPTSQEPGLKNEQNKSAIIDLKPQFQQAEDDEDYEN